MHLTYLKSTVNKLLLFTAALMITLVACEGPAGPEGPQGPKGEQGVIGPAGEDGSVMYAGKGAPTGDIGKEGDYYLNNKTGELYGPKNDKGWGTPISLKGPPGKDGQDGADGKDGQDGKDGTDGKDGQDGQDGEDGSRIYSGTSAPKPTIGNAGDFYLNTKTFDLYGPKNPKKKNAWGTPINLKGTANVMYSSWTTIDSAVRDTTIDQSVLKVVHIDAPQLSQEILDQGVINVYMKFFGSIVPLPYTGHSGGKASVLDFLPRLNRLYLTRFTLDNSGSISFSSYLEFRYVIIPGGVAVSSNLSKEQLNEMSYQEVKQRFGIRE